VVLFVGIGVSLAQRAVAEAPVDAEEPYRVIVLVSMTACCESIAYPEAEQALVEELSLLKIPVTRVLGRATDESAQHLELETLARQHKAAAAIRLSRPDSAGRADAALWITDQVTQKTVYRRIQVDKGSNLPHAMITAIRTVETLRASLLEFRYEDTAKKKPPVSEEIEKIAYTPKKPKHYLLGLGLAGGLAVSPGGMGERGAFSFAGMVQPLRGLDLAVSLNWSPFGQTLETERARSDVDYLLLRGWAVYRFFNDKPAQPAVGAAGGVYFGRAEGRAPTGQPLKNAKTRVAYLGGSARVYAFAGERVSLFLDTTVGALMPKAEVVHGTTSAADFGHPLFEVQFGLELRFLALKE
jgi:hypothetical protein